MIPRTLQNVTALLVVLALCACSSGNQPQPEPLKPRVVKNLFATGAGPNDMVFGNNSLYIANSMDNSVVRYSTGGAVLSSHQFAEFASPSFLALSDGPGGYVWVACNGDDTLEALDASTLEPVEGLRLYLTSPAAFTGPSQPVASDGYVVVPRSQITEFGPPSEYGPGNAIGFDPLDPEHPFELDLDGVNAQFSLPAGAGGSGGAFLVTTGEIQFDEFFSPHVLSDSFVQLWNLDPTPQKLFSANLGKVGAGRLALNESSHMLYIGNSLSGNLYVVDTQAQAVLYGEANPIQLTDQFTFVSDVALSPDGKYLFSSSFNTDEVFVVQCSNNQVSPAGFEFPFDLSLDPELLAGCSNLEVAPSAVEGYSYSVFVLHAVANSVSRIDIP